MECDCRYPINFYNDTIRYRTLIILYFFDLIFFTIRLTLIVSDDISKGLQGRMHFLVPIIIFDSITTVPIVVCDILSLLIRHCIERVRHDNRSLKCPWRLITITCLRFRCHKHRPQAILLMQIIIISCSFLLKFICFTVDIGCAARFQSKCTAYIVIAALALLVSIWIIIVEVINYFCLWKDNPTDTRNLSDNRSYSSVLDDRFIEKTHRSHLVFFIMNYQMIKTLRNSVDQDVNKD